VLKIFIGLGNIVSVTNRAITELLNA